MCDRTLDRIKNTASFSIYLPLRQTINTAWLKCAPNVRCIVCGLISNHRPLNYLFNCLLTQICLISQSHGSNPKHLGDDLLKFIIMGKKGRARLTLKQQKTTLRTADSNTAAWSSSLHFSRNIQMFRIWCKHRSILQVRLLLLLGDILPHFGLLSTNMSMPCDHTISRIMHHVTKLTSSQLVSWTWQHRECSLLYPNGLHR